MFTVTDKRTIFVICKHQELRFGIYKEYLQSKEEKIAAPAEKRVQGMNWPFAEETYTTRDHRKGDANSLIIREMQIKTIERYRLPPIRQPGRP